MIEGSDASGAVTVMFLVIINVEDEVTVPGDIELHLPTDVQSAVQVAMSGATGTGSVCTTSGTGRPLPGP